MSKPFINTPNIDSPFRYAAGGFSLPLEKFCKQIHNDTLQYARLLGEDDRSFIPKHLEPPPQGILEQRQWEQMN